MRRGMCNERICKGNVQEKAVVNYFMIYRHLQEKPRDRAYVGKDSNPNLSNTKSKLPAQGREVLLVTKSLLHS
jgi:hypothetical protein